MKIEPGGQFTMGVKIPYDRCQSKKRKRKKSTQIPISAPDAQILRGVDYFVAPLGYIYLANRLFLGYIYLTNRLFLGYIYLTNRLFLGYIYLTNHIFLGYIYLANHLFLGYIYLRDHFGQCHCAINS
jgi:hypothetical protein